MQFFKFFYPRKKILYSHRLPFGRTPVPTIVRFAGSSNVRGKRHCKLYKSNTDGKMLTEWLIIVLL